MMSDKIRLEITFTSGETITYPPEQWDDYAYDGKAVIVKLRSAWVGIYNFDSVFCVELKPVRRRRAYGRKTDTKRTLQQHTRQHRGSDERPHGDEPRKAAEYRDL